MDSFDQAQQQINQDKLNLLSAMAQYGSQGKADYAQTQADLTGQKQAAIQAALAEATRRGAPQAELDSISYQIGAPYDRRLSDLTSSQSSAQNSLASTSAAGTNYMDMASAAIPAERAAAQRQLEAEQYKAQQQAAADALSLQLKQIDEQIAQANLEKAREPGGSNTDPLLVANRARDYAAATHEENIVPQIASHEGTNGPEGFGPRAMAAFNNIVSNSKDLQAAMANLEAGTKAQNGHPQLFWQGRPQTGMLDYNAMQNALQRYYAPPSQDEIGAVLQQFYGGGG